MAETILMPLSPFQRCLIYKPCLLGSGSHLRCCSNAHEIAFQVVPFDTGAKTPIPPRSGYEPPNVVRRCWSGLQELLKRQGHGRFKRQHWLSYVQRCNAIACHAARDCRQP